MVIFGSFCNRLTYNKIFSSKIILISFFSPTKYSGDPNYDRKDRCPCKNGPACKTCSYCAGCSCRCHTWFTLHFRFFTKEDLQALLQKIRNMVSGGDPNKFLDEYKFTRERLDLVSDREARPSKHDGEEQDPYLRTG